MAHGSPRKEICNKCNTYGLIPRFSESECPNCGGKTEQISNDDLKRKIGLMLHESLNIGFSWQKLKKNNCR